MTDIISLESKHYLFIQMRKYVVFITIAAIWGTANLHFDASAIYNTFLSIDEEYPIYYLYAEDTQIYYNIFRESQLSEVIMNTISDIYIWSAFVRQVSHYKSSISKDVITRWKI